MLSEARKKVLLDLFAVPIIVLPVFGGAASLMLSWAVGGNLLLNFIGISSLIAALCGFATRMCQAPELFTKQKQYEYEEKRLAQTIQLDSLDIQLTKDKDFRTQTCLREIRHLYDNLQADIQEGKISPTAYEILNTVEELFHACVEQLKYTYELWESSRKFRGKNRKKITTERDKVVEEVEQTVGHLAESVQQFHLLKTKRKKKDLSKLREQLDEQIGIARRTEQKRTAYQNVDKEFETFIKE